MTDKLNEKLDEILMWLKLQCPTCEKKFTDIGTFRMHMIVEKVEK